MIVWLRATNIVPQITTVILMTWFTTNYSVHNNDTI
jgi:hypothetical protein